MEPEFFSYEPRIIFIIKVIPHFFTTYVFEQLSLMLKIYFTLDNILSISFNPRIIFEFFMGSILISICLEAFCVKPRRREIRFYGNGRNISIDKRDKNENNSNL